MSEKIYYPEIIETYALPEAVVSTEDGSTNYEGKTNIAPSTNVDNKFPPTPVARETLSEALNTRTRQILGSFTFGEVGAISIGTYENGVSGDIRITPNGITARDINGNTTFSLDGTNGDAVFKGTIQAGAIISGAVSVGANTVLIDGANQRIVINDGTDNRIVIGEV